MSKTINTSNKKNEKMLEDLCSSRVLLCHWYCSCSTIAIIYYYTLLCDLSYYIIFFILFLIIFFVFIIIIIFGWLWRWWYLVVGGEWATTTTSLQKRKGRIVREEEKRDDGRWTHRNQIIQVSTYKTHHTIWLYFYWIIHARGLLIEIPAGL